MFRTRITELFGIQYPLIMGGMQWISNAELVAAAGNAGGIGFLTVSSFEDPEDLRKEIRKIRELTDKPFGVNVNLFPSARPTRNAEKIAVALEEEVRAFETSGHSPESIADQIKAGGAKIMHKCARVRDAVTAQRVGVDAVTVVGYECGGHPSMEEIGNLVLIPKARDAVSIPLAAGGGFADARGFVAALALGAEAVVMGTRFMATTECRAHANFKQWMVDAAETDTAYIQKSIRNPMRVLKNEAALKVMEMEAKGATLQELLPIISGLRGRLVVSEGDLDAGTFSCGQSVGLIDNIKSVKEVYEDIIGGATEIVNQLVAIRG